MSTHYNKLITKLRELFELDKADLDFGIYRIIAQRQTEIAQFLEHDLKRHVQDILQDGEGNQRESLQRELDAAIKAMRDLGMEPSASPKVKELEEKLSAYSGSEYQEIQSYEHLYRFFSRYYEEGDFISQRRVSKDAKYAIPYNGEEVKLHWANADQYYIKSSENFRDYRFKLGDGRFVNFKLQEAQSSRDNTKGDKRFFMLADEAVTVLDNGELQLGFYYQGVAADQKKMTGADGKEKTTSQKVFNELALQTVEEQLADTWQAEVFAASATKANPKRTLLEKHLNDYTAKNSFDYFIHKDLGGFLRRELDFYIKNEVMELDDVVSADADKLGEMLQQIKAIRRVADLVISFLAQLENFQRKLWLKKKFVVKSDYCFTLDRLPESLYGVIAENAAQRREWVELGFIADDAVVDVAFLAANPFLLVDTRFFEVGFKYDCLSHIDGIDEQCDGLLIHGDNFQALNLLQERYREKVKCIYIDPPYNTGSNSIPYKNGYKHSSWGTMMFDRIKLLRETMKENGAIFLSIDKVERTLLEQETDTIFGNDNRIEELIWSMNTNNSQAPNYSTNHEYVLVYAKNRSIAERDKSMFREPKPGFDEVMTLVARLNPDYPPVSIIEQQLKQLYKDHKDKYRQQIEEQDLDWEVEKRNDSWKGLFNYHRAEYRDNAGKLVDPLEAKHFSASIWIWREDNVAMPATKQATSTQDKNSENWRFYQPPHPTTGQPCPHPKSGWKFRYGYDANKQSFEALDADARIAWGLNEEKVPQIKRYLHEVETNVGKSIFTDYSDGEKQTSAMFGRSGVFLAPKHANFVARFIQHATEKDSLFIDCFGGSGSSGHGIITTNRIDSGQRKYILVEQGEYFNTVLKPRIQKAVYAEHWKGGKPTTHKDNDSQSNPLNGVSHCFKTLTLESYEDTQNNLVLNRTGEQQKLLEQQGNEAFKQDYTLNYMLDIESKGSLLNIQAFEQPFSYQMHIATDSAGETRLQNIDLIETFNYLIGLTVHTLEKTTVHIPLEQDADGIWQAPDKIKTCEEGQPDSYTFLIVSGQLPNDDSTLVIWRVLNDFANTESKMKHNMALDTFVMDRLKVNPKDKEIDAIFVNGDNTLPNIRSGEEHWKVRLIEEEFQRLMFAEA